MKDGDIFLTKFLSKEFLFQVIPAGDGFFKGIILAHNLEGHVIHTVANLSDQSWLKHKELKEVSPNDLPLYLDMKVLNPEFLNLIKERGQKHD
jgi:hypothetical protein